MPPMTHHSGSVSYLSCRLNVAATKPSYPIQNAHGCQGSPHGKQKNATRVHLLQAITYVLVYLAELLPKMMGSTERLAREKLPVQ